LLTLGYFPYHLNKPEFHKWICPIYEIPIEQFGYKDMKVENAKKLKSWYDQMVDENFVFNMKTELQKYCENDVDILLRAIMCFRKLFQETTQLDPFSRNFTLASVGLEYFRAQVLEDNQLGVTPIEGYSGQRKFSKIANIWIDYQQKLRNTPIIKEYRVGPY
jgi:DNA polymerase type B, organellar and viral